MAVSAGIERSSTTEQVYEIIKGDIINAVYPGGHQLKQDSLAKELKVSRIPVREALVQLESEGFVRIEAYKGAVVTHLTVEDAIDQFETRMVLEPFLAVTALENASDEDTDNLATAFKNYREEIEQGASSIDLSHLNWAFHQAILEPCNRPRSLAIVQTLHSSTERYIRLQITSESARKKALKDHRLILKAFKERDAAALEQLVRDHIQNALRAVIAVVKDY